MKDYTQYGEQKHILEHFKGRTGTFLSLGENDGETLSNVRALALDGWRGVCVEPAPIAYGKLAKLYEGSDRVMLVNAAICDKDGTIDFWDSGPHLGNGDSSLLSTTVLSEVEKWRGKAAFRRTTCQANTFASLMDVCRISGYEKFDFISIDCEGQDWNILKQINLTEIGCEMLCIEANLHSNPANADLFRSYAAVHGMILRHRNGVNMLFDRG